MDYKTTEIATVRLQMSSNGADRYSLTIPKAVANILSLRKGEEFGVSVLNNDIVLHRKEEDE